jgi:hypothetical protein
VSTFLAHSFKSTICMRSSAQCWHWDFTCIEGRLACETTSEGYRHCKLGGVCLIFHAVAVGAFASLCVPGLLVPGAAGFWTAALQHWLPFFRQAYRFCPTSTSHSLTQDVHIYFNFTFCSAALSQNMLQQGNVPRREQSTGTQSPGRAVSGCMALANRSCHSRVQWRFRGFCTEDVS